MNGEIHNAYNFYITNIATIVTRGNFKKQTSNYQSIEQRKDAVGKTLKTAYYQGKGSCKNLKTNWLNICRMQRCT